MEVAAKKKKAASKRTSRKMSLEKFLQWEQPEDHYKYEWVDGSLEKTEYMMKNTERGIVKRIQRAFTKIQAYKNGGELFAETKVMISDTLVRIPDLEMVKVLTSPKLVKVCFEKDVCSAKPAVPGLEITVKEFFGVEHKTS